MHNYQLFGTVKQALKLKVRTAAESGALVVLMNSLFEFLFAAH